MDKMAHQFLGVFTPFLVLALPLPFLCPISSTSTLTLGLIFFWACSAPPPEVALLHLRDTGGEVCVPEAAALALVCMMAVVGKQRVEMSRAKMSRAEMSRAELSRARAKTSRAEMSRAKLLRAEMSRAKKSRAEKSRAETSRAETSRAHQRSLLFTAMNTNSESPQSCAPRLRAFQSQP
jgi:hypothetical protein